MPSVAPASAAQGWRDQLRGSAWEGGTEQTGVHLLCRWGNRGSAVLRKHRTCKVVCSRLHLNTGVLLFPTPVLPGEAFSIAQTLRGPTQLCPPLFPAPYTSPSSGASLKPLLPQVSRPYRLPSSEAVTGGQLGASRSGCADCHSSGWDLGEWRLGLQTGPSSSQQSRRGSIPRLFG